MDTSHDLMSLAGHAFSWAKVVGPVSGVGSGLSGMATIM
jgi:hypothetical protein